MDAAGGDRGRDLACGARSVGGLLGLGAGWNETEYRAFGFPYDHRISRFEEAFTVIRTLLREGAIDFAGQYYTLRDCELLPRGARPGGPPLLIGSSGPRMLRITMPYAHSWNAWYLSFGNDLAGIAAQREKVDAACREVGRDPAEVKRTVAVFVRLPGAEQQRISEIAPLEGEPAQIAAELRAYAAQGISHVQLVIDPVTPAGVESLAPILESLDAD